MLAEAVFAFLSIDDAAIHALKLAKQVCDPHYECGGVIRVTPSGYVISDIVRSKQHFHLDLNPAYGDFKGVVADFHTHVCSIYNFPFAAFFSSADAASNDGLHTIGYILDLCTGNIHRYIPGVDDEADEEVTFKPHADGTTHEPIFLTIGHIVGWVGK